MGIPKYTTSQRISAFWSKVDKSSGEDACWLWLAGRKSEYGGFWDGNDTVGAHVFSYRLAYGHIPEHLFVCHSCDNPVCVNPKHLWLGTSADNTRDKVSKGRSPSGDRNGARLHPDALSRGDGHYARQHPELLARGERHGSRTRPERIRKGEDNGRAKLTDELIREIRMKYAQGDYSQQALAIQYCVSKSLIGRILRRESWKHVD